MKDFTWLTAAIILMGVLTNCIGAEHATIEKDEIEDADTLESKYVIDTVVTLCGIEYPDGYDWKRDTAYGKVNTDIVLFRNDERMLTIHTGGTTGLSTHEDMHFFLEDGHLYSIGSSKGNMVIFRDGSELFDYKGQEMITGMVVDGDDVYTLGQNRSGDGFSYRRNGKSILTHEKGHIAGQMNSNPHYRTGALYRDSGQISFMFWSKDAKGEYKWTLVTDGAERELSLNCDPGELFDIRYIGGEVHRLASTSGTHSCVLITGATELTIGRENLSAKLCSIGPDGSGDIIVTGQFQSNNGSWNSGIWSHAKGFRAGLGTSHYYAGEGGIGELCFLWDGRLSVSQPGKSRVQISGEGVYYPSARNGALVGGNLFLALNPKGDGKMPGYWFDGHWKEVEFNGFLTDIHVELVKKEKED